MKTETMIRIAKRYESAQAILSDPSYLLSIAFSFCYVFVNDERRYKIDLNTRRCDCPDFARHGDFCKHTLAMEIVMETEAQLQAAETYLREMENAEDVETGCSPL